MNTLRLEFYSRLSEEYPSLPLSELSPTEEETFYARAKYWADDWDDVFSYINTHECDILADCVSKFDSEISLQKFREELERIDEWVVEEEAAIGQGKAESLEHLEDAKFLIDNLDQDWPYLNYVDGYEGTGRRDFALLQAELWKFITEGEIVSNIESCPQAIYAGSPVELDEWIAENPDTEFIFVYDGPIHDDLYLLLRYIYKKGGNCIIIGQHQDEVPIQVDRLCTYTWKESKKVAKFYESQRSDTGEDHIKTLRDVPPTSLDYDTMEASTWMWSDNKRTRCVGSNSDDDRCGSLVRDGDHCDVHAETGPHVEFSNAARELVRAGYSRDRLQEVIENVFEQEGENHE